MKKKLFLTAVMVFIFVMMLAFAVSADSVHNENTVDYNSKVTLNDGTVLPIYDENKDALIWYIDGKDESGNPIYSSAPTDKVAYWYTESWNEVTGFDVVLENGTKIERNNVVVVNMMDDDVVKNAGPGTKYYGEPVKDFKNMINSRKNLEYCFLRLDTSTINNGTFAGCPKLKYINLESLTNLKRMAQHSQFSGCTSLFDGQVLDLTKTQLYEFEGNETFKGVPVKGIKFPETMKKIGSGSTFANCSKLEFISVGNKLTTMGGEAFSGCTSLKAIYYVGTQDELNASPINRVVTDATIKSYNEYKSLTDISGVYVVYNYSRCIAFNNGVHGEAILANACVGNCLVCGDAMVNHNEVKNLSVTITYKNYGINGEKVTVCNNKDCGYKETKVAPALIVCRGYSAPENGRGGIVIGFDINSEAIKDYETTTGKTLKYGAFAGAQEKLGTSDIFSENGTVANYAIAAEIASYEFSSFELKITGFTDEYKDTKLALGAYVIAIDKDITEYSYIQHGEPKQNEKYVFTSYDEVVNS